jgi:hypothetical protein
MTYVLSLAIRTVGALLVIGATLTTILHGG